MEHFYLSVPYFLSILFPPTSRRTKKFSQRINEHSHKKKIKFLENVAFVNSSCLFFPMPTRKKLLKLENIQQEFCGLLVLFLWENFNLFLQGDYVPCNASIRWILLPLFLYTTSTKNMNILVCSGREQA